MDPGPVGSAASARTRRRTQAQQDPEPDAWAGRSDLYRSMQHCSCEKRSGQAQFLSYNGLAVRGAVTAGNGRPEPAAVAAAAGLEPQAPEAPEAHARSAEPMNTG